jgi:hypothetical protein
LPACANRQDVPVPTNAQFVGRWMPGGREIAYNGDDGNLWALPLDGGQPRRITSFDPPEPGTTITDFAWSRDGQRLAILRLKVADDIVLFRGLKP